MNGNLDKILRSVVLGAAWILFFLILYDTYSRITLFPVEIVAGNRAYLQGVAIIILLILGFRYKINKIHRLSLFCSVLFFINEFVIGLFCKIFW